MKTFFKKKKKDVLPSPLLERKKEDSPLSYIPLFLLIAIVNDGQGQSVVRYGREDGAAVSFLCHGRGTADNDLYEIFGLSKAAKQVVFMPMRADVYPKIRKDLLERFGISAESKGVAALIPMSGMIGHNAYRLLADERISRDAKGAMKLMDETPMKKDYELVVAIVNDGFTDLVMEAARSAGARGGTILTAKGTGNKDIESFFGIVITPEKQLVLIMVPKDIRNAVIEAIYKSAGLHSKGQGIVFALPASDVLGLSGEESVPEETTPATGEETPQEE